VLTPATKNSLRKIRHVKEVTYENIHIIPMIKIVGDGSAESV